MSDESLETEPNGMRWLMVLVGALAAAPVAAQQPITYERYTLDNGLAVYLVPLAGAPVVTVNVWYNVGSRNERPGRSGFAHLFEHMMFQGSASVPKREHTGLVQRAGGNVNGTTDEDRTLYFETLPANRLNLGLWLEADRMRSLAITDENFENQREAVKEERRLRVDNQPYAGAFVEGLTLAYDSAGCFPYSHSVIGSMADLDAARTAEVRAFFDLYYAPNNATLTITGDFEPAAAKRLIQQYFGGIPPGGAPPPVECAATYDWGPRRVVWEDRLANLPAAIVAYRIPPHREDDTRPLTLLATILASGESSRLHRVLVREQRISAQALGFVNSRRGPGLMITLAIANQGQTADTLAAALQAEVARIARDGVTREELEKARNAYRAERVFERQTSMGIAEAIQHYAHYHDDVAEINTDLERYLAVTAADIQRVARRYLVPENSLTVLVVPAAKGVQP